MLRTNRLNIYITGSKFNIEHKNHKKVIGEVSYKYINNEYLLSFSLLDSYQHKGFAYEALKEIRRYLLLEIKAYKISFKVDASNESAVKLANKLKMNQIVKKNKIYFELKRSDYIKTIDKMKLYSFDGQPVDFYIYRGEPFPKDVKYGVVDILIHNTKYDKYLVTRRDLNKESYPGYYEITGGAICYLESEEAAGLREVKEETGITLNSIKFVSRSENRKAFYFAFFGECDCELDSVVLQENETIDYKWFSPDEFLNFFKEGKMVKKQNARNEPLFKLIK